MRLNTDRLKADGFTDTDIQRIHEYSTTAELAGSFNAEVAQVRPQHTAYLCCRSHAEILDQLRPGCWLRDFSGQPAHGANCPCCSKDNRPLHATTRRDWENFEQRLLALGGTRVLWPGQDLFLTELLSRGHPFAQPVELLGMRVNHCHENAALVWGKDINATRLAYGYALDLDQGGLWRHHGWCVKAGTLLETTAPMKKYFGIELSEKAAVDSWFRNFLARRHPKLDMAAFKFAKESHPQVLALIRKYDKLEKRRRRNSFRDRFHR